MSESQKSSRKKRKKDMTSSIADEGLRGLFTRLPLPGVNGHLGGSLSVQDSDEGERERLLKEEETEREVPREDGEQEKESEEARIFRIQSVGSSEMSASVAVPRPVIQVTVEDSVEHTQPSESKEREKDLSNTTTPLLFPERPDALAIPTERKVRGGSAGPNLGYGSIQSSGEGIKRRSPSHSPASSPRAGRRRMRKTISGKSSFSTCSCNLQLVM